jgi:type I restriction enzyme R subunit
MAERAKAVQESFEERQTSTADALAELMREVEANEKRKRKQVEKGFDGLTYFVYSTLLNAGVTEPERVSRKIKEAFVEYPNWASSEKEYREVRQKTTFALCAQMDDLDKVASIVDQLFTLLLKAQKI